MSGVIRHRFVHYLVYGMSTRVWAPAVLLVILTNSFSRSWAWNYEWLWAMDTLSFSSIFLVPLCAGIAAFEVGRLAVARDLHLVSPRATWAVVRVIVSVWVVAAVAVLVSFAIISGCVFYVTSGLLPHMLDLLPVPLLLAIVASGCAAGGMLGWVFPSSRLMPGLTSLGIFALMMCGYIIGGGSSSGLVSVGGATGSLVGLRLSLSLLLWQCLFYGLLTAGLLWFIRLRTGSIGMWQRGIAVACVLAILGAGIGVLSSGERLVAAPVSDLICSGEDPQVCLAPGYAAQAASVRTNLKPYIDAFEEAGVEMPDRVEQGDASAAGESAVQVDALDIVDAGDERARSVMLRWLDSGRCPAWGGGMESDPRLIVRDWMSVRVQGAMGPGAINPEFNEMSADQQDFALREAVDKLAQCDW